MQIGPRIRVGGSIGKGAQKLKENVGKVASNPWVQAGLGALTMNPLLVAGAAAAGRAADTTKGRVGLGDLAKAGMKGGVAGYAGSAVGGLTRGAMALHAGTGAGYGTIAGEMGKAAGKKLLGGGGAVLSGAKKLLAGGGTDDDGHFGLAGDLAGKLTGGDHGGILDKLLLGAGVATSAIDRKHQQDAQNRAAQYATDSYDSRAGLREKGLDQAMHNSSPDLSGVFSDSGNPYDVQRRKPVAPPAPRVSPLKRMSTLTGVEGVDVGPKVPVRRLSY